VFDPQWLPICAIELKHRSANQGTIRPHINELEADLHQHIGGGQNQLPLIQIGLFTEIRAVENWTQVMHFGLYRFLVSHFHGTPRQTLEGQVIPENFGGAWTIPTVGSSFSVGGVVVYGRVARLLRAGHELAAA
jgi:hypothetical protein